jgi:hypothetical protein
LRPFLPLDDVLCDTGPPHSAAAALNHKGLAREPGTTTTIDAVGPCTITRALNQESSYKGSKRAGLRFSPVKKFENAMREYSERQAARRARPAQQSNPQADPGMAPGV